MKSFLAKAIPFVAVFSIIRALVGIYFASYLSPEDYVIILVPMVLFAFLDIYIEGGYRAAIIKLEKVSFLLRVATYSLLLASSFFGFFMIKIIFFIIIEITLRLVLLIAENIRLFFFFKHKKINT